jgi:hypothetical protein
MLVDQNVTTFRSGFLCVNILLSIDFQIVAKQAILRIWITNLDHSLDHDFG